MHERQVVTIPAKSERQQRFMALCKHNPSHARGECPDQKTASEFSHKPKGGYRKKPPRAPR